MKGWFARACFVAPVITIIGAGATFGVAGASSNEGGRSTIVSVVTPETISTPPTPMADPPPVAVTPISVPPGVVANNSGGQSLSQTITLVILPG
jgi:hypothetical protein